VAEYHTRSGKLADPAFRAERARKASRAAHSLPVHVRAIVRNAGELTPEDAELLRSALEVAAPAPPLTGEQRSKLAALLTRGGDADGT
jgi:hypothetical protein